MIWNLFIEELKAKSIFIIRWFGLITLIYGILRIVFIAYNYQDLNIHSIDTWFTVLRAGLRYDFSAIFLTNIIVILFTILPISFFKFRIIRLILLYINLIINIIFILINCIDIAYYPFVGKRMQSDILLFINGAKGDEFYKLLPTFIIQYIPIWIIFVLLSGCLIFFTNKIFSIVNKFDKHLTNWFASILFFVFISGISIIAIRGGLQLRPLQAINATEHVDVANGAAVLNSSFTFLHSFSKKSLQEKNYFPIETFDDCELGKQVSHSTNKDSTSKLNVVIIIVESLSKAYLKKFGGPVATPFLDSLMDLSLVFTNGFANAKESVQGIPAIISSMPHLMDQAYIFSRYASNHTNSIASVLKSVGYTSSFFHAGKTGTMGFNAFTSLAGFDHYYGKEDYPIQDHYDGAWGIWDHYFFPFMVDKLNHCQQPFFATVFTMNPHSPFKLPQEFESRFQSSGHPLEAMLRYEDYALSIFFGRAKTSSWFDNTIFVVTADHTGPSIQQGSLMDEFRIPIIFFDPKGIWRGTSDRIASQIDIMPTLLNHMHIDKEYYAMGTDLFSSECRSHGSAMYRNGIYHYIDSNYYIQYADEKLLSAFDWTKDSLCERNLVLQNNLDSNIHITQNRLLKTIQLYNNNMIHDRFFIK